MHVEYVTTGQRGQLTNALSSDHLPIITTINIRHDSEYNKTDGLSPTTTHPKVLGLTLDQKPTYSTHIHNISAPHIHNISALAHNPLQVIKALTGWGKQKETLMATYKAVMRPALEYASSKWSPLSSSTSINKQQVMQNAALRTATGCTQDTNIHHLHDEHSY